MFNKLIDNIAPPAVWARGILACLDVYATKNMNTFYVNQEFKALQYR